LKFTSPGAADDDESLLNAELLAAARIYRDDQTRQIMVSYTGRVARPSGEGRRRYQEGQSNGVR